MAPVPKRKRLVQGQRTEQDEPRWVHPWILGIRSFLSSLLDCSWSITCLKCETSYQCSFELWVLGFELLRKCIHFPIAHRLQLTASSIPQFSRLLAIRASCSPCTCAKRMVHGTRLPDKEFRSNMLRPTEVGAAIFLLQSACLHAVRTLSFPTGVHHGCNGANMLNTL